MALDLRTLDLIDIVPDSIADDPEIIAMSAALTPSIQALAGECEDAIILPAIATAPQSVLDALARQFRVSDLRAWKAIMPEDLVGKRALLAGILDLRRRAGTRYAVRRCLDLLRLTATVIEWWEEGAAPHTFRIDVDASEAGLIESAILALPQLVRRFQRISQQLTQLGIVLTSTAPPFIRPALTTGLHITIGSP